MFSTTALPKSESKEKEYIGKLSVINLVKTEKIAIQ